MKKGSTALIIVLVVLAALIIGGFVASKFLLPKLINSVVNTSVNTALSSLEKIDFSNATTTSFEQDLSKNEGMFLQIGLNKGKLYVDGNSLKDTISGEIKYLGVKPTIDYKTGDEKVAYYTIKSADQEGEQTTIHLSKETNGRIDAGIGAGVADIDLREVDIPYLNIGAGAGSVKVTFSDKKSTQATLAAGVGILNLVVPNSAGIKITFGQGANFSDLQLGKNYVKTTNGFETKDYDNATVKIDVTIGQALGGFNISAY